MPPQRKVSSTAGKARSETTRAAILRGAENVFARLGFTETTMNAIAAGSGVSRPTVYAYFSCKDDVFRALAISIRDEFLKLQEVEPNLDVADILRRTLANYLDTWAKHLGLLTVINHQALGDPEMHQLWHDIHHWPNRRNSRFIARLADEGVADPVLPPEVVAEMVTGATRQLAEQVGAGTDRSRLTEHLVTLYLQLTRIAGDR